jgi:hypothetical protein
MERLNGASRHYFDKGVYMKKVVFVVLVFLLLTAGVFGQTTTNCSTCNGTGKISQNCISCLGKGSTPSFMYGVYLEMPCYFCAGTGKQSSPCYTCNGTGKITVAAPAPATGSTSPQSTSAASGNTTRSNALALRLGQDLTVTFSGAESRWYSFDITQNNSALVVQTRGSVDTLLDLYDSNGNRITSDDDSGDGFNARISRTLNPGKYYVEVKNYDKKAGQSTLNAAVQSSAATPATTPAPAPATRTIPAGAVTCTTCNGSGIWIMSSSKCTRCNGTGSINLGYASMFCVTCMGTGTATLSGTCPFCHGNGWYYPDQLRAELEAVSPSTGSPSTGSSSTGSSSSSGSSNIDVGQMVRNYQNMGRNVEQALDNYRNAVRRGATQSELNNLRSRVVSLQQSMRSYRLDCNSKGASIAADYYETVSP